MAQIDIEALNSDIAEFKKKLGNSYLKTPEELNDYISESDKILAKYPDPEGEARKILGEFCEMRGSRIIVFGNDLEHGIPYYHKAIELDPDSYNIRWGYYTTLEEIIKKKRLRTPELVQDAIDCLQFCIDYCDTPELQQEHNIPMRYIDLGNVYLIADQPEKAAECANKLLAMQDIEGAKWLMKKVEKQILKNLKSETEKFKKKYSKGFRKPEEADAFISDAEKILAKYPDPEDEAKEILAKFCTNIGCRLVIYANDPELGFKDGEYPKRGISYYHKAMELCPNSYDIRWGYYTTLEEIVENEKRRTPELIQEAIDCLQFCIDYCNTPELIQEHYIQFRYVELARVYLAAGQPEKAAECARKSLEIKDSDSTRKFLEEIESQL